jgi:aryl-alcohol dehydrogenase-like predicted oxidoreductase
MNLYLLMIDDFYTYQKINSMVYQQLGKSNLKVSRIAFGCMSLKPEQSDAERILHRAVDLGINYFDTADLYDKGENEKLLGKSIGQKRKDLVIATKVGNQWRPDGSGWDWNPTKAYILKAADESLRRLQTDYIDLYQLHGGTIADPIEETIEAFELLVAQGKIRFYGLSSIRPNVIRRWIDQSSFVSVMMQYSLLDRRPEEIMPLLLDNNIPVLARGSIAQGLLVNKPPKSYADSDADEVAKAANVIHRYSGRDRSAPQTALQFVLSNSAVASAVVGIRTMQQLEEAAGTISAPLLTNDELKDVSHSIIPKKYKEHR